MQAVLGDEAPQRCGTAESSQASIGEGHDSQASDGDSIERPRTPPGVARPRTVVDGGERWAGPTPAGKRPAGPPLGSVMMQEPSPAIRSLAVLVDELDDRLPRTESAPTPAPGSSARPLRAGRRRSWTALMAIMALAIAAAWAVGDPTRATCEFEAAICPVKDLDIDAFLLTVPEADLFDVLPSIDVVDPHDSLTLGEVLRLEGVRDLEPSTLLTPSQIDRVLRHLD